MADMVIGDTNVFSHRQVPWHGLGTKVDMSYSSEEAIKMAGLDWDVLPAPIYSRNVYGGIYEIPSYVANTRSDTKDVLGIVSNRYKIVQNREAFSFTDHLIGEGVRYEAAGIINKGKRIWLLAKMPEANVIGDKIAPYLVFTNSHDGKGSIKVCMTPIRVVCNNALNLALREAERSWFTVHLGDIESKLSQARNTLALANGYLDEFVKEADFLVDSAIYKGEVNDLIEQLFPIPEDATERKEENVLLLRKGLTWVYNNSPDIRKFHNTKWGVINAVSDFITHTDPQRKTATYKENRFAKVIDGHPVIDKAYSLLVA